MLDSPTFRHLKEGYTLHVHTAGGGRGYALHVYTTGDGKTYTLHTARPKCWLWKGIHPACPFCWLWKWIHSDSVRQFYWRWKRDTPSTFVVHTTGCGNGYTLHVHTAGCENGYTLHVHTAGVGGGERDAHCPMHVQTACGGKWCTLQVHRQLLMVLYLLYDIEKLYVNAGMLEKS